MRRIHIYWNSEPKRVGREILNPRSFYMKYRVPRRQTLIFLGPLFIRIAPKGN